MAEVVLEQIATATGFSLTFKAFKYAYYGRELMNIIINDDVLSALGTAHIFNIGTSRGGGGDRGE